MSWRKQDVYVIVCLQCALLLLFGIFVRYETWPHDEHENSVYPMFQDVHVMIFVGFGFLMTFLRKYGFSSVGFNFLLAAFSIQWALICGGIAGLDLDLKIRLNIVSLVKADIAAAAVLISMGAVLGRTSYMQLLVMGIIEIVVYNINSYLCLEVLKVSDAGGSVVVHTFGAYFGLAVSFILNRRSEDEDEDSSLEESSYTSDLFAMIGTLFLWMYWPSFNAAELNVFQQNRAVINTYLALASCCVTSFAMSLLLSSSHKFNMVHVQNSTLAGGVAVGTAANLTLQPFGAIIVGILAGIVSVYGYAKLTPWLRKRFRLVDTCGVHNLHGMPGVLAGIVGAIMAGVASRLSDKRVLNEIYFTEVPNSILTTEPVLNPDAFPFSEPVEIRSDSEQAGYQLLAIGVTLGIAIVSGLVTGLLVRIRSIRITPHNYHSDAVCWMLPNQEEPENSVKSNAVAPDSSSCYVGPALTKAGSTEMETPISFA